MLVFDMREVGNRMYAARKRIGLTQAEVAESAGLSDRGYADIERGKVNVRLNTLLRICLAVHVTPNELLVREPEKEIPEEETLLTRLKSCGAKNKETAFRILSAFLSSVE